MTRRPVTGMRPWRPRLAAAAMVVAAVACSGIITGPDAPDTSARSMRVTPTALAIGVGDTARLTASLFDASGAITSPSAGTSLTYASSDSTVARVDATGLVTGVAGGTATVRSAYGALALGVTVTVQDRLRLVVVSGDGQTAQQGDSLGAPLVVEARDGADRPVAGAPVVFEPLTGGGSADPASRTTDSLGRASTRWRLGTALGAQLLRARLVDEDTVVFAATATAGTRVFRVQLSAPRTTLVGLADGVQLLARAFNVVDSIIPGAAFSFSSGDTAVATVSPAGFVSARAYGTTTIRATSGAFTDSVVMLVQPVPATGSKRWTGRVSDDWFAAANWEEGSVPSATDSVHIPAVGVTNLPRLAASDSVRALVNDNVGALRLDDVTLYVGGVLLLRSDVLGASCAGGGFMVRGPAVPGTQVLAGRMACSLFLESGGHALTDSLVVSDHALILSGDARLIPGGHAVRVPDQQIIVQQSARLEMALPTDRVYAPWISIEANGQGSMFADGVLELRDRLVVAPGTSDFIAGGDHRVVFSGPSVLAFAEIITAANVRLQHAEFRQPVAINGSFALNGNLTLRSAAAVLGGRLSLFGLPERLRVGGDFTAEAGATTSLSAVELGGALTAPSFAPDTLVLIGTAQRLPLDGTVAGLRSVRIAAGASATARVSAGQRRAIAGDLLIEGDFGIAEPFAAAMQVDGALRVTGAGLLRLGGSYSSLRVQGNALFDGRAMTDELASGDLELRGDLVQRATTSINSLRMAPGFGVVFIGSGVTDFAAPDSSWLGQVSHWGGLTRTLRSDLTAHGGFTVDLNDVVLQSDQLGAGGTRRIVASGLDLGGVATMRNVAFRIIDGLPIDLTGGPTFRDFDPAAIQLDLQRNSGTVALDFATFSTTPSAAGRYLRVNDPTGTGDGAFTVNVSNVTPATHGGAAEAQGAAIINGWPSGLALPRLRLGDDIFHPAALQRTLAVRADAAFGSALPITLRVLDSMQLRLAPDTVTAGRDTLTVHAVAGDTALRFVLQAMEAATGTGTLIASAPGYAPDTLRIEFATPAMQLRLLGAAQVPDSGGPRPALQLRVGFDDGGNLVPMALRAGGPGATFTVRSLSPSVAQLRFVGSAATTGADQLGADSVTFTLRATFTETTRPDTLAATPATLEVARTGTPGVVAFGSTGPAGWTQLGADPTLEVLPPAVPEPITLGPDLTVPMHLMRADTASFATPRSGTSTVTLRSLAPSLVRVSADAATAGADSVAITVGAGASTFVWWAHAVADRSDTSVMIVASGPGLVTDTLVVHLAVPSVQIVNVGPFELPVSGGPEPELRVRVGLATIDSLLPMPVRVGATAPQFQVVTLNALAIRPVHTPTEATEGPAAGPADTVVFGLRPGFAATPVSDSALGIIGALRAVRTGVSDEAEVAVVAPAGWAVFGDPAYFDLVPLQPLSLIRPRVVARGLQSTIDIEFVDPAPSGAVATLRVLETGRVLIAANRTDLGADQAALAFAAGDVDVRFVLNALEQTAADSVTLVAEVPGYATDTLAIAINDPVARLLATGVGPYAANGPEVAFQLETGAFNDAEQYRALPVRPGTAPSFTLTSGSPAIALLRHQASPATLGASAGPATAVTFGVAPGASRTPDGSTVGVPASLYAVPQGAGGSVTIALGLPIGWSAPFGGFSLTFTAPPAPGLTLAFVGDSLLGVSLSLPVRATLGAPAPVGGRVLRLASLATGILSIDAPDSILVAAGATQGEFILRGVSPGVASVVLSADGLTPDTLAVEVTNRILSLSSTLNVPYGLTTSLPIQLATPAPPGGLLVTLTSSDPTRVGVNTATVSVAAGQTLASGTVSGVSPGSATITATAPGWVSDTTHATTTLALDVVEGSVAIDASFGSSATVALRSGGSPIAAPTGGVSVGLLARNPGCVAVPATATVTAGATQVAFGVSYGGATATPCSSWVVATAPNAASDSVVVNVAVAPFITTGNLVLGSGTQVSSSAGLSSTTFGSVTVRVQSLDPAVAVVAPNAGTVGTEFIDIPITAPSSSISFHVAALENVTGTARVLVTAPGFRPDTAFVSVRALGIEFISAPSTLTSFSSNFLLQLRIGGLNEAGTAIDAEYAIRAGGSPITVTVTNSASAVGRLVTNSVTAQSVTAVIPVGSARTPTSLPAGSIEFDPLGAGTTTLTLTAPGITSLSGATRAVTVTAPGSSVGNATLGAGTQLSFSATLGAPEHGGVTARVEVGDSSLALVAPDATTTATGALDIAIPNGSTSMGFFIAAREGVSGTTTLIVSAPGFAPDTSTITVRPLGIEIISAPTTTTSFSPNTLIQFRVGGMNEAGTFIEAEYPLRFGGTPITATLTNSNAAVAQLHRSSGDSQSAVVTIPVGSSRAPTSLGSGAVEFDPIGAGTTTLTLTSPGITSLPNATWTSTVTAPNASLSGGTLGAGMQASWNGSLGASEHGGVTVRVESSDPATLLLAPNATTAATAFIDVPMANGQTSVPFYVVAPEAVTGSATVTITAPGFNSATATFVVRGLGVEIISAPSSITTLSPNALVQLRVGFLTAAGTSIEGEYPLRFNGTPITATVSNSNATVGQLVTSTLTGQAVTAVIPVGSSRIPTSIATGGIEFDPLSSGATSLVVSAPGMTALPGATWPVTVTSPTIAAGSSVLGSGMHVSTGATLGASNYGTVTVRVESSDPALVRVAPDANTLATAAIDVPMTAPSTFVPFYVAALEGVTGTATVTVSAPGFTSATYSVVVRGLGIELISWPSTILSTAGNYLLQARVGYLNAAGTTVEGEYPLRFGATPIPVTITNSASAVARLITSGGATQSASTSVSAGSSRIPTSLASGAVEFDPLSGGSTTLSVSAPGVLSAPSATQTVTVDLPPINVSAIPIGAGHEVANTTAALSVAPSPTTTVTITVSDSTLIRVNGAGSHQFGTAGTGLGHQISALEGVTGTATVTISAVGYQSASYTVTVRPMAIQLGAVPATTSVGGGSVIQAFIGTPIAAGTAMEYTAATRQGAPPLVITFATSDATRLVFDAPGGQNASPTVTLAAASSAATPTTISLRGLSAGAATISVSAPNALTLPTGSRTVTVTP